MFFSISEQLARTKVGSTTVSTIAASDSKAGFETAIKNPLYNENHWIIVECYDSKQKALTGHQKWCKTMENPPEFLREHSDNMIAKLCEQAFRGQGTYPRKDIKDSLDFDLNLDRK